MQEKLPRVLVTGGSGYVAGWVIVELLRRGFSVRTTVRSAAKQEAIRAAVRAQAGDDELSFCEADLRRDDGWDAAANGCAYVVHVASPMGQGLPENADLLGPARDGSLRVLRASARAGVKRLVLTSSLVAAQAAPGAPVNEAVWTDTEGRGSDNYVRSKTLAERAAWEFAEKEGARAGLGLTTVLPALVLGPVMTPHVSGSAELVARMLDGRMPGVPRVGFTTVDVRDLARLHVDAMLASEAAGERVIAAGDFVWIAEMANYLREALGARAAKVPTRSLPDLVVRVAGLFRQDARFLAQRLGKRTDIRHAKAERMLGWKPREWRETLRDTAVSLLALRAQSAA